MLEESRITEHFAEQAEWCDALGSPFTAALLRKFAIDFEAGGPIAKICSDWTTNPRKDALGLRLAGFLHHAVLTDPSSEQAVLYPAQSANWNIDHVWRVARRWLDGHVHDARVFIKHPPQTNETRRSIILLPGFLKLAAKYQKPLHLLELGASAGLNQNWDAFSYRTSSWHRTGDSEVEITTDWRAPVPQNLDIQPEIASRAACDLNPVDLTDKDQVRRLKSYTWPDQADRMNRLDAAIALAQDRGTSVDAADALAWLSERLLNRPNTGLTVVYHSVFLIYPPRQVISDIMRVIRDAGQTASSQAPLAWLSYESEALFGGNRASPKMRARLETWPDGIVETYAESDGHVTYVKGYSDKV